MASRTLGVPVVSQVVREPEWTHRYGVTPDGHVTWRAPSAPGARDHIIAALSTAVGSAAPATAGGGEPVTAGGGTPGRTP